MIRAAEAEEIAAAAVLLTSDNARSINGHTIGIEAIRCCGATRAAY